MKHLFIRILFFLILLLIPSCGVWENFTTYFNLYYNTKEAFQQAEEAILLQERSIFETAEITVPGTANQLLNRVVEKTSKILQFHGTTPYLDDALLMLGKSFYYQRNYLKAVRKFQELTSTQKESELYLEAELWTAKCQMRLKEFEDGLNTLDSVLSRAQSEENYDILIQAYIEEIIYYVSNENYTEALKVAIELIPVTDDDAPKAEIIYETGNFYLKLGEPENAIKYFEMVDEYNAEYNIQLNALLARARTLRELGREKEALDIFEEMRLEDKYRDEYDIVDYEIGMSYLALNRIDEAVENFIYVDTSYQSSFYSGLARYNLGMIYENKLLDYDSAAAYYQKATTSQLPKEKVKEVHARNQLFTKYRDITFRMVQTEKQIFYIDNPDAFVKDSAAYFDSVKAQMVQDSINASLGNEQQPGRNTRPEQRLQTQNNAQKNPPARPQVPKDSLERMLLKTKFDLGNLFFTEMEKPDSAVKYYSAMLNDTSAAEYYSRCLYAMGNYYVAAGDSVKADSIFNYIYNNYKTDRLVNAAALQLKKPLIDLSFDPAGEIFASAEKLWMQQKYDSALTLYYDVYRKYPSSSYAPKALLAGGWILEDNLRLPDSAAVLYDTITVKYPGTVYAVKINPRLIAYKQELARIQREKEDSIRVANMKADSLKKETVAVKPDSLSEEERIKLELEKSEQEIPVIQASQDTLKPKEIKPETLLPHGQQNQERRNPRRRR